MLLDANEVEDVAARGDARAAQGVEANGAVRDVRQEDDVDVLPGDWRIGKEESGSLILVLLYSEAVIRLDEVMGRSRRLSWCWAFGFVLIAAGELRRRWRGVRREVEDGIGRDDKMVALLAGDALARGGVGLGGGHRRWGV